MSNQTRSSNSDFGTVRWAQSGSGRLTRREKVREIARANQVLLSTLPAQVRLRLGLRSRGALTQHVDEIPIPDSAIAREAEELCRDAAAERIVNHSYRTYVWGMLLGRHDGLRPDAELLFVGSMLHDLALTDRFRDYAPMPCFGARAGLMAIDWARDRGWPEDRCRTLGDSISLHLNAKVPCSHGPEAVLLQAGAGLDVIGMRAWSLSPETRGDVLRRYPMLNFLDGLSDFSDEAHPGTRTQLLMRWLRFETLARHSPVRAA